MTEANEAEISDPEVYQEFIAALQKHGQNVPLMKARARIAILLSLRPDTVDAYLATRYGEV